MSETQPPKARDEGEFIPIVRMAALFATAIWFCALVAFVAGGLAFDRGNRNAAPWASGIFLVFTTLPFLFLVLPALALSYFGGQTAATIAAGLLFVAVCVTLAAISAVGMI